MKAGRHLELATGPTNVKMASLAGFAPQLDGPIMKHDNVFDDRETKTGSACFTASVSIDPIKAFENA